MKRKRRWIVAAVVLAVLVAVAGLTMCGSDKGERRALRTARVARADFTITVATTGTVEADVQVEVKSRASGEVIEMRVQAGDTVQAGDLLVKLDPVDEERNVAIAEASLQAAAASLAQARSTLDAARAQAADNDAKVRRRAAAYQAGLISAEENATTVTTADVSRQTVLQREADLRSAQAAYNKAKLNIDEARRRLAETIIRAPITGTVLATSVEKGTIVASGISNVGGGTTLLTLADLSKLYVVVQLDEASIGSVKNGQQAVIRVDAYPDAEFKGVVERITPLGKNTSNVVTFDVNVLVTDDSAALLYPGMSADVEIISAHLRNVLTIPMQALRTDTSSSGRFVVMRDGERRPVTVGATDGTTTEVLSGLKEGETIIVAGDVVDETDDGPPNPLRIFSGRRR